jgi:hypothetical protein
MTNSLNMYKSLADNLEKENQKVKDNMDKEINDLKKVLEDEKNKFNE